MARIYVRNVPLDQLTMDQAVARITDLLNQTRTRAAHVVTVNAQFFELAYRNPRFAAILLNSDLSVADGLSLVWASRLLRQPVPERVGGVDLLEHLCAEAARRGSKMYFLGGKPGSAEGAARRLRQKFPGLQITVDCPARGFFLRHQEQSRVEESVILAKPDIVFVALGAPLQEYWIDQCSHLPAKVMIGVGGSFELISGFQKRAPRTVRRAGFEWLWRLCMEPRRLWKRYLIGNSLFIYLVFRLWIARQHVGARVGKRDARVEPAE